MRPILKILRFLSLASLLFGGIFANLAHADIAVVVPTSSPIKSLSQKDISDIYLGRLRSLQGVGILQVLDHPQNSLMRERFFMALNGMDLRRVNAYWARLQFSGDTQPPMTVADNNHLLKAVSRNVESIGYVDAANVTDAVRTVYRIKE